MNRRHLLVGAGSAVALGGISWSILGGGGSDNELNVSILGEDSSNLKAISEYLDLPHIRRLFRSEVEATDFNTASEKALSSFAQGSSSPDIVLGYNFSLSPYVRNRYIFTLRELKQFASASTKFDFERDILPNVWSELGYYSKPPHIDNQNIEPVAYPFCANTMVMVYDRKVIDDPAVRRLYRSKFDREFTPPATWEEFADVAQLVVQANPDFRGVALQGAADGWLYYEWMNFLFGMGGSVMEKSYGWQSDALTPLNLRTVEAAKAAQLYLSLKPVNAGDFFSVDAVRQRDIMTERKTAFAIMWTDYIPQLDELGDFGFAPVPGTTSMLAGGCFFVNRKSRSPSAALELIAHLQSPEAQRQMALNGLFPATRIALSDPEVLSRRYMPAVKTSLERGVYMLEAGVDSTLISQRITDSMQRAWRGDISALEVGAEAMREIERDRARL